MESGVDDAVLRAGRSVLRELSDILGLFQHTKAADETVPEEIAGMVQERSEAREAKNWADFLSFWPWEISFSEKIFRRKRIPYLR